MLHWLVTSASVLVLLTFLRNRFLLIYSISYVLIPPGLSLVSWEG